MYPNILVSDEKEQFGYLWQKNRGVATSVQHLLSEIQVIMELLNGWQYIKGRRQLRPIWHFTTDV